MTKGDEKVHLKDIATRVCNERRRESAPFARPLIGTVATQMMRIPERPSPLDAHCHICHRITPVHYDFSKVQVATRVFVAKAMRKCPENRSVDEK